MKLHVAVASKANARARDFAIFPIAKRNKTKRKFPVFELAACALLVAYYLADGPKMEPSTPSFTDQLFQSLCGN